MTAQRRRNGYAGRRKQQQKLQQQQQQQAVAVVPQQSASEEESTDSGSVTRCVCGEIHNVGLMVQCDQCEVWQHCECVGLEEEDIPDQYYCEECKPHNHAVVKLAHGRTKRSYSSVGRPNTLAPAVEKKTPKKRMTFNSREASMSLEDVLAARSALETNLPSVNESSAPSSPVQETSDKEEEEITNEQKTPRGSSKSTKKEIKGEEGQQLPSPTKQRKQNHKKSSPVTVPESDDMDVDPKEQDMETAESEVDTVMTTTTIATTTTTATVTRPAKPKRGSSGRKANAATAETNNDSGGVTSGRVTKTEKRPRGGGPRRTNSTGVRRAQSNRPRSRTSTPQPSDASPGVSGSNNNNGNGYSSNSNNNGPLHHVDISTAIFEKLSPAAREASPPAKVRIPSSRMTVSEMNRRAKQILEYISSIQVEMATKEPSNAANKNKNTIAVDVNTTFVQMEHQQIPQEVSETSKKQRLKPSAITIPEKSSDDDAPSSSLSSASTIPLDPDERQQMNEDTVEKGIAQEAIEKAKSEQSSMEIMDTLTRELIRFQRRFGATHDSVRGVRSLRYHHHHHRDNDGGSGSEGEGRVTRSREASANSSVSNFLFERRIAHI